MIDKWQFLFNRLRERLWVRPLMVCVLSIAMALLASLADGSRIGEYFFDVSSESVETLLQVMSSSMLVIATFAVGSMVAAYSAASATATPRSFPLVVSDDVSQNALSTFVGAFIFSIVALIAIKNGYYESAGTFVLFVLTLLVFAIVIVTFVRWVDNIARLGRLGSTVEKAEAAAARALRIRKAAPVMGGAVAQALPDGACAVYGERIGYVQRVEMSELQAHADETGTRIILAALPGTFAAPGRALAYVVGQADAALEIDPEPIRAAFVVGSDRTFDEDPRFGLIVLSEIACRALSPAVNDPGTAIDVIGSFVRLFAAWAQAPEKAPEKVPEEAPEDEDEPAEPKYPLVEVPELSLQDMFDDAFTGISRDGAAAVEVVVRLLKAYRALTLLEDLAMRDTARSHARAARARAETALKSPEDLALVRSTAQFADEES